jgi:hypothetical protein
VTGLKLADTSQQHTLWTKRGDQLLGRLLTFEQDTLNFQLPAPAPVVKYHRREVVFVGLAGEAFPQFRRATTRYMDARGAEFVFPRQSLLYSATALAPENRGSYRNNILLINEVEFNLSEHFSLGAGAFVPPLIILRAQARLSLSPLIHLGLAGNYYAATAYRESYTHPYLALTLGNRETYINLTYGYWLYHGEYYDAEDSFPIVTIGGSHTFSQRWRIFFEGVLYHDRYDTYLLPTGYFNYLRRRTVYGFGLWGLPQDAGIPMLPWFSYTYLF